LGKTDADNKDKHRQQSIVVVPRDTPGITVVRPMQVFGFDDAPEGHMEVIFKDVRVPVENIILGEGRGFEVIQGRLGPGRIHHCMRCIGMAERGLDLMLTRVTDPTRRTFGKILADHGTIVADIATSRIEIDQARFLVLSAARKIDFVKAKGAMKEIGMAKIVAPNMLLKVLDRAMPVHCVMLTVLMRSTETRLVRLNFVVPLTLLPRSRPKKRSLTRLSLPPSSKFYVILFVSPSLLHIAFVRIYACKINK
jgi:acyl-CoA dehydrogenase